MDIEFRSIGKTFGKVKANVDLSFSVPGGTIVGVLGENGAGKSTLMKIFSGFIRPDSGRILLDGKEVRVGSPLEAASLGIGMLHQDPLDFPPFSLLDDFVLGGREGFIPDKRKAKAEFLALGARFGFSLVPEAPVSSLTVGERQQLEILRLLRLGAKVLVLDEPTTGISLSQKEKLFAALLRLAAEGMTVFLVSHKLEDVSNLCSRAVVLRQGVLAGAMEAPFDTEALVRMMFGRELELAPRAEAAPGRKVLTIRTGDVDGIRVRIRGLELQLHAGQTIGLAGMEGSGQDLFLGACAGLVQPSGGEFCLDEEETPMAGRGYLQFRRHGVAYLPAARLEKGLVPGLSLAEHFVLAAEPRGLFIDQEGLKALAARQIAAFNIKGKPESPVESLSGGNQQRALLSLLPEKAALILIEHPTRGLDIESTIYIWAKLKERCAAGASIVFISSDLDELLQYSDKVMVFFAGKVSPPLPAGELDVARLGALIGGVGWTDSGKEAAHAD